MYGSNYDSEGGGLLSSGAEAFSEASVRRGFMRKVYGILSLQLLVTSAIAGIFFIEPVRLYAQSNSWIFFVAMIPLFGSMIALVCCNDVRRKSPGNLICLGIFTLAQGVLLGAAVSVYNVNEIMMALGITVIVVLGLTLFALQTKVDFTACGGILLVGLLCLMMFGFFVWIFPSNSVVNIVYASLGAFIFGIYIIFDTQMMMGGKHKYALDPEEYIFASLNLYLDIINLFLFILQIIGNARGD